MDGIVRRGAWLHQYHGFFFPPGGPRGPDRSKCRWIWVPFEVPQVRSRTERGDADLETERARRKETQRWHWYPGDPSKTSARCAERWIDYWSASSVSRRVLSDLSACGHRART